MDNLPSHPMSGNGFPDAGTGETGFPAIGPGLGAIDEFDQEPAGGEGMRRYLDALLRYKWLILVAVVLGGGVGFYMAQRIRPAYVAQATIWIETEAGGGGRGGAAATTGPIQGDGLLQSTAWVDLLETYVIFDHVVRQERLYLEYGSPSDSVLFSSFQLGERFRPGEYELRVSETGDRYELVADRGLVLESGAAGDSIGAGIGFSWHPPAESFGRDREVRFSVLAPRDASNRLMEQVESYLPERYGNFLRLELSGRNPTRITATLNALAEKYVEFAGELKRAKLDQLATILEEQLIYARTTLDEAEMELEAFRVETITLPTETSSPVAPGIEATRDPAFESFFGLRIEREQLRRDAAAIRSALTSQESDGSTPAERLWIIEAVQQSSDLRTALEELTTKQADLRTLLTRFTPEHPEVRRLAGEVESLERTTIPMLSRTLLAQLDQREATLASLIDDASSELREIPPRMIEEARLRRRVDIAETLYTTVQSRFESARLAAVSSIPDVRILDLATVPNTPINPGQKPKMIAMALFGALGLGIGLAILLDRFDRRVRYPTQVTTDMGLPILGAIQLAPPNASVGSEMVEQVVESFRELRLAVMHAHGAAGPLVLTITSPGSGDGKSFVSANLALAFADLGYKTLVVDGDIRRGTLHHVLGGSRKPGLTDFLAGEVSEPVVIQRTQYPNIDFVGAGAWRRSGPELLASPQMRSFMAAMRTRYRVIVVDSSPLGAGVDPYVLGTLTGNLMMVLRTGSTDRDLAEAKLDVLQRLPIRILGAALNAVPARGAYRYYSYISSYQLPNADREPEEEHAPA